ncbi:MAG: 6-bladed beta-propeller [Bacillota bacterium]
MQLTEFWARIKQKKINQKDLTIAILVFIILALVFFGWYYFRAKRNPLDIDVLAPGAKYRYLFSIYDPENLRRPLGVTVSPWGDVLIADSVNHRIAVFDRNGGFKKTLGGPGSGAGQFNYPSGVAVSGKKIYVADFYNQRVQVIDFDGKQLSVIPSARDRQKVGPSVMPVTVTTDRSGNLYVSDLSLQRILVFNDAGKFIRSFGRAGSNPGELSYVNGIAVDDDGDGRIYLSNSNNGRVDEYTMDGRFVKTISGSRVLTNPKGITFDRDNHRVYVADTFAHQIFGIGTDGNVFENIGKRGIDSGGFNFPTAVATDDEGRLYIADRENNRVEVYAR